MQSLFVDNLTVIDFAYFHPCRGIVGESLILDVELFGELNNEGMLFDFSFVKKRIKSTVDALIDHKFLVAREQANAQIDDDQNRLKLVLNTNKLERFVHVSPHQAVYFVKGNEITPRTIAAEIKSEVVKILPNNVSEVKITLRSEPDEGCFYHYSHGLKKHFGDCQRIAHGHRSKIKVWIDGQYSEHWSAHVALIWKDIYLATEADIKDRISIESLDYLVFEYHANQGLFQLTIPERRCFLMKTDTTVELIATFLAEYIKQKCVNAKIKVQAYEGVDKGACVILN